MPDVICNVCREPITDPSEQVDRKYKVKANGLALPPQKKHDQCDKAYEAEKTGLEKVQ